MNCHSKQRGFTLVEISMTLLVAGVMMAIAYPSFVSLTQNQRAVTMANQFIGAIKLARSEAIKRSSTVSLCPANTAQTACGDDWTQGWLIFVDPDNNGVVANNIDRLRVNSQLELGASITPPSGQSFVSFGAQGFVTNGAGAYTLVADNCEGQHARTVTLSNSGRVEVSSAACS